MWTCSAFTLTQRPGNYFECLREGEGAMLMLCPLLFLSGPWYDGRGFLPADQTPYLCIGGADSPGMGLGIVKSIHLLESLIGSHHSWWLRVIYWFPVGMIEIPIFLYITTSCKFYCTCLCEGYSIMLGTIMMQLIIQCIGHSSLDGYITFLSLNTGYCLLWKLGMT